MTEFPYRNRTEAGRELAKSLTHYLGRTDLLVLALPRGGVPVAVPVAEALGAELDILIVRKLGLPRQPELAMGAIASGGICIRNEPIIAAALVPEGVFEHVEEAERRELLRREHLYRGRRARPRTRGRTVALIDDGLATGSTMHAAIQAVRKSRPAKIVVAVPVGASESLVELQAVADEVVCPAIPVPFGAIGSFYRDFTQVPDDTVRDLLRKVNEGEGSDLVEGRKRL